MARHDLLLDSAVFVLSCTGHDDGMLWHIVSGRSQQSPMWKRIEVSAKKDHPNLKQLGECSYTNAWIDRFGKVFLSFNDSC